MAAPARPTGRSGAAADPQHRHLKLKLKAFVTSRHSTDCGVPNVTSFRLLAGLASELRFFDLDVSTTRNEDGVTVTLPSSLDRLTLFIDHTLQVAWRRDRFGQAADLVSGSLTVFPRWPHWYAGDLSGRQPNTRWRPLSPFRWGRQDPTRTHTTRAGAKAGAGGVITTGYIDRSGYALDDPKPLVHFVLEQAYGLQELVSQYQPVLDILHQHNHRAWLVEYPQAGGRLICIDLPDGTHLTVTTDPHLDECFPGWERTGDLPARLDQVTGWSVEHRKNGTLTGLITHVYNTLPNNNAVPGNPDPTALAQAITRYTTTPQ